MASSKAIWTIFVILLPYLGVFVYLIARGHKMGEHAVGRRPRRRDEPQRAYIQSVVTNAGSPADELAKLAELKDKGLVTDEEFATMKAKILG